MKKILQFYQKIGIPNISYVPQSISLIDDTLERNIALAINDENIDKKIDKVIELSNLDRFVNKDQKKPFDW